MAPSPSARWTAAQRIRLAGTRPATPGGDLDGERRLYRDVAGSTAALPGGRAGALGLRTRIVDAQVAHALGHGTEQIVVLGAGYDGRALRFADDGVRWFELDRADVLEDKRRRLDALGVAPTGVTSVSVDLEADDVGSALEAAGHQAIRPSLFVCETVLLQLALAATATLCTTLRTRAAPASSLVATFAVAPEPAAALRTLRATAAALSRLTGEARHDELRPGDPEKLMVVTGWHVTHAEWGPDHLVDRGAHQVVLVCEPRPLA